MNQQPFSPWDIQNIYQRLRNRFVVSSSKDWVHLYRSSSGLLNITVVSDQFRGISYSDRRIQVNEIVQSSTGSLSLYTQDWETGITRMRTAAAMAELLQKRYKVKFSQVLFFPLSWVLSVLCEDVRVCAACCGF